MSLKEYNKKRDFKKTKEPAGKAAKAPQKKGELHFVIQKHAASHLHYDFRLELDGVLKSWAVPKGPSLDPTQKRLAMQVEDHPIKYASFEGTIPKGQYGGGTVMVWDRGTWTPTNGDPSESLEHGGLKFSLEGEKLHGNWALFRIKKAHDGKAPWLLVKEKDKFALRARQRDVVDAKPKSVISGRDLAAIASNEDGKIWTSGSAKPRSSIKKSESNKTAVKDLNKASKKSLNLPESDSNSDSVIDIPAAPKKTEAPAIVAGVKITHPNKLIYPNDRIKKVQLAEYYEFIAERMLPHVANRPLMVVRCPNGTGDSCFFQKNWNNKLPASLKKIQSHRKEKSAETFFAVDSAEGLIDLAQLGALEIHCWNTHSHHLEHPDQWVFDLDPGPHVDWQQVTDAAFTVRKKLKTFGLESFLKTTGGKGLHVVVPVLPKLDWKMGKTFSEAVCKDLMADEPDLFLTTMSKAKRDGKIFLDYLRNGRGATAVAPYSTRSREHAPISVPISWEKLKGGLRSTDFNLLNFKEKLKNLKTDPWARMLKLKQFPKI